MATESLSPISAEDLGAHRHEASLSNGTKVVTYERRGMPVHIEALFLAGGRHDKPGLEGTSHFHEHMFTSGSERFPTKDLLAGYIERYGGSLAASTGHDTMSLRTSCGDPNDTPIAIEVMHEMLMASKFDEGTIDSERGAIHTELRKKRSNPDAWVDRIFDNLVFQSTDLGRFILGTDESIDRITRETIMSFYREMFVSGRMVLVASGEVAIAKLVDLAEKELLLPPGPKPAKPDALPVIRDNEIVIAPYDRSKQVDLVFGFRTVPAFHSDSPTLSVLAEALGRGRASSLIKKLRYEKGFVYGVSASASKFTDAGEFSIDTTTSKENLPEVLSIIQDEIKRVSDNGLSADEVDFAQRKIVKSLRYKLQSSYSWTDSNSYAELVSQEPNGVREFTEGIIAVTPEKTREVAQRYFGKDKWYLAMCGDVTTKDVAVNL